MEQPAPLTSNEKAVAISVLVVGALVLLLGLFTVAGSAYTLATGKVMGGEMSKAFARVAPQRNDEMQQLVERQLKVQAEIQAQWAPYQLSSECLYLGAVAGAMLFAIFALRSGAGRARLGQLALLASAARVVVGVVTFMLTSDVMRATTNSLMTTMPQGGQRGLSPEKTEQVTRIASGAAAGISAFTAGCMTLVMCIYFGVVAYMFLAAKKQEPPAPAPPAV